jgi:aryl sulfotransferase
MRHLAGQLGITVPGQAWPALTEAATFEVMRRHADQIIPDAGILKSSAAFFRRGSSGAGREVLSDGELAMYQARAASMAPPGLLSWLHRGDAGQDEDA